MQAVILAAGRGTRMGDLTATIPKPMLEIRGRTLLEYKFDALPAEVDEVILIVGYFGGTIEERFGTEYKGKRLRYVEQDVLDGTGGALWRAKDLLEDKFLVLNGDDLYAKEDLEKMVQYEWALLVQQSEELQSAAKVVLNESGNVEDILEKEVHSGGPGLSNLGAYLLDMRFFDYELVKRPKSEEYGLPQTIVKAADDIAIHPVEASFFLVLTSPEDLQKAEAVIANR